MCCSRNDSSPKKKKKIAILTTANIVDRLKLLAEINMWDVIKYVIEGFLFPIVLLLIDIIIDNFWHLKAINDTHDRRLYFAKRLYDVNKLPSHIFSQIQAL